MKDSCWNKSRSHCGLLWAVIHFNCLVLTIYSTSNQRQECFIVTIIKHHLHAFTYIPLQGPSVNVFCGLNVAIPIFQEIYIPHCYLSKKNIYPPCYLSKQRCECILVWGKLFIIVYNLVIVYFAPNIDRYFRQKTGRKIANSTVKLARRVWRL